MARKFRCNVNLDKLRISLTSEVDYFNELLNINPKYPIVKYDGFYLHIVDFGRGNDDTQESNQVIAILCLDNDVKLGTFTFNSSRRYNGRIFFKVENRILYDCLTYDFANKRKVSCLGCVFQVFYYLDMQVASITEMEIAIDKNSNTLKSYNRLLKDPINYKMIVNGKKVTNPKKIIHNTHKNFSYSRNEISRYPSIYIEQANDDAPKLKIYNKSKEIEEKERKQYIADWNDFGSFPIYRTELTIFWNDIKQYMKDNALSLDNPTILEQMTDPDRLEHLFDAISPRLLRFNGPDGECMTPKML